MSTPRPGQPVRGSQTGRPIMALLDVLGRRWVLRIIWELHTEPLGFRELRVRCDEMSSSVLAARLTDLLTAGIAARADDEKYHLTDEGGQLVEVLNGLNQWAGRWAERQGDE